LPAQRSSRRLSGPPAFVALGNYKEILLVAADVARKVRIRTASSTLLFSQHLSLLRLVLSDGQDTARISRLLDLSPPLRSLVRLDGARWVSTGLEEATRDLATIETPPLGAPAPNLVQALVEKVPKSRSHITTLRTSPDDPPAVTRLDKSALAKAYWSKVWDKRTTSTTPSERASFLRGYDSKVDHSLLQEPDLDSVLEAIAKSKNTAAGPDGIPFAAWRAAPDLAAPLLLGVLQAIFRGHNPPEGFNHGLLFLLPKKLTGLISDTRPLSVTNTDNRLLAACVARGIMPAVSAYVSPCQKGFLSGKDGGDHIVEINTLFYEAVVKKYDRLLFLLDTAKAFDSIDHDWISHVLSWVGFPPWFRNFVKGSLSSVKVAPFFGGVPSDWIDIRRGVKQGCPLSPLLFLIAYDPLLHFVSLLPSVKPFAFADDLALFSDSVESISPALTLISRFSVVSGLGINKTKSLAIPTADEPHWPAIRSDLRSCPWPDLPLLKEGTHLGIVIGRDVTLEKVWEGPVSKAVSKINTNLTLLRSLSLSSRILYVNVFIVSLFSYISLFFILPPDLWSVVKETIRKVFPFNGGAYTYTSLVCAKQLFRVRPALKDVWAFNLSLLAVRSPYFRNLTNNYFNLPKLDPLFNMFIKDHRDIAAIDFWRASHLPDGRLVPPSPPTSSEAYKLIVEDVYLDDAVEHVGKKIHTFLTTNQPTAPPPPPL